MGSLKTMAIIYEASNEKEYKSVLDKLMFGIHCFTFICVNPKQESTYSFTGGELSNVLQMKLDAAQEIYIINPKGSISKYLRAFLIYAEETGKPVHYMYKYCYTDCTHRRKKVCALPDKIYGIPHNHKLLPACESYCRIYDNYMVTKSTSKSEMELPNTNVPDADEPATGAKQSETLEA